MNRNLLLSLCGLVGAVAMLATTGCNNPTPPDKQQVGAIGSIEGTISWVKGVFQPNLANIRGEIDIKVVTVTPIRRNIISVAFGTPLESDSRVTVTYTVSNLPVSIPIRLEVTPKQPGVGSFARVGNPQDAVCTLEQPTVSHFDFQFMEPPK
jgi:hypothetical protein